MNKSELKLSKPKDTNKRTTVCVTAMGVLAVMVIAFLPRQRAQACSRILYETGNGTYITGRPLDWNDPAAKTALWV